MTRKEKKVSKKEWEHATGEGNKDFPGYGRESPDDIVPEWAYEDEEETIIHGRDDTDEMPDPDER